MPGNGTLTVSAIQRSEFFSQLRLLTSDALHSTRQHGLILLDIDAFRFVNASGGVEAGDYLIEQLSACLCEQIKHGHICGSLGGGCFAILLPNTEYSDVCDLASELLVFVSKREFFWQESTFSVTISAGLTLLLDSDSNESVAFSRAETALYKAKRQGGNCVVFIGADVKAGESLAEFWAPKIHHAFLHDGFQFWSQPVIDPHSRDIVLTDISYTLESGSRYIPASEFNQELVLLGMSVTLDRWLIRKFRDHLLRCGENSMGSRYVFALSAESVKAREFWRFLGSEFFEYPLLGKALVLSLPYRLLHNDIETMIEFIECFDSADVMILLDDFGTGLDSLLQLNRLKVDYVRIAGELLNGPPEVCSILSDFIRASGKQSIGVGADSESALEGLNTLGFDLVQGALLAPRLLASADVY